MYQLRRIYYGNVYTLQILDIIKFSYYNCLMIYIHRTIEPLVQEYITYFPVVAISGPRQSGKSTLVRHLLSNDYTYMTLDDYRIVDQIRDDPERFFLKNNNKIIIDEVQRLPEIFLYIKRIVDEQRDVYGRFILTGSSQFSLHQKISETLAGRIGLLKLLPFDYQEVPAENHSIISGCYPELVMRSYRFHDPWYSSYVQTYIERDVQSIANIRDIHDFSRLIKLLAAQVSCQLNYSYFSKILGVSVPTVKKWVSILEASYIIYLLRPYHSNLGKRLTKAPKIYFYDTGLAAYLTKTIDTQWEDGPLAGPLFENYIVIETLKNSLHTGNSHELFYFREHNGDEIDLIIDTNAARYFIEIRKSMTYKPRMGKHLLKYADANTRSYIIYQGETLTYVPTISVMNYRDYLQKLYT